MSDVVARIAEAAEAYFGTVRRDGYIVDGVDADELAGVVAEALGLTEADPEQYRSAMCPDDQDYDRVRYRTAWLPVTPEGQEP